MCIYLCVDKSTICPSFMHVNDSLDMVWVEPLKIVLRPHPDIKSPVSVAHLYWHSYCKWKSRSDTTTDIRYNNVTFIYSFCSLCINYKLFTWDIIGQWNKRSNRLTVVLLNQVMWTVADVRVVVHHSAWKIDIYTTYRTTSIMLTKI